MDVSGPLPRVRLRLSEEEPTNLTCLLRKPGIIELARLWKPKRNYTIKLATSKRWLFPFMSEMREGKPQRPISISPVRIIDYSACWVYKSINPPVILELRQAFSLSCFLQICSWNCVLSLCLSQSNHFTLPFSRVREYLEKLGHTFTYPEFAALFEG